jgi:PAS domain S-box-containing protein
MGIYVFVGISNIFEHALGVPVLDPFEDYAEILFVPFFLMFLYSLVVGREVVARQDKARELDQQKAEFEAIFRAIQDAVVFVDMDRRIVMTNPFFTKLFGYSLDELKGKTTEIIYADPADFHDQGKVRYRVDAAAEEPVYEMRYRRKDGTEFESETLGGPVNDREGKVIGYIGVIRDISQRKESEKRLARSESYLRAIIDNEPECVKLVDGEGVVLDMNPAGLAMLDTDSPQDVIGKPMAAFVAPEYHEALASLSKRVLKGESLSGEFRVVGLKGTGRFLESYMVPFEDRENNRTLILAVTRDISKRKSAEEELKRAMTDLARKNLELQELDRMKDSLLRDVSHELKTPVAKHSMQLEILKPFIESAKVGEREAGAFEVMRESIRRQEGVIRNLLDLGRLESGGRVYDRKEVALDTILSGVKEEYQGVLRACGGRISENFPSLPPVLGDKEMFWHAFSNIINNAIKFRRQDVPLEIAISARPQGGNVLVEISDNGIGLEEGNREKVFNRFYQVTASSEGSGVGLAISRRIIEDLGGRIWIDSEGVGRGAKVSITLPLAHDEKEESVV